MTRRAQSVARAEAGYRTVLAQLVELIHGARRQSARAVNAVLTAVYWEICRRIVDHEQQGAERAGYGEACSPGCRRI